MSAMKAIVNVKRIERTMKILNTYERLDEYTSPPIRRNANGAKIRFKRLINDTCA
jgi:hypothetical protein